MKVAALVCKGSAAANSDGARQRMPDDITDFVRWRNVRMRGDTSDVVG